MKLRHLALIVTALTAVRLISAETPAAAATTPASTVVVTTTKRSNVRVGSMSLPVSEGTKLEVYGREGDSLVVKYRSNKGKLPASDTDYNPATTKVPELAPEPAAGKPADITIGTPAPAPTPSPAKTAPKAKAAQPPAQNTKAAKPVTPQPPPVVPPANS